MLPKWNKIDFCIYAVNATNFLAHMLDIVVPCRFPRISYINDHVICDIFSNLTALCPALLHWLGPPIQYQVETLMKVPYLVPNLWVEWSCTSEYDHSFCKCGCSLQGWSSYFYS